MACLFFFFFLNYICCYFLLIQLSQSCYNLIFLYCDSFPTSSTALFTSSTVLAFTILMINRSFSSVGILSRCPSKYFFMSLRCLSQSGNIPILVHSAPSAGSGLSFCRLCARWVFHRSYSSSMFLPFNISIGWSAGIAP